jgi:hypothetical protein
VDETEGDDDIEMFMAEYGEVLLFGLGNENFKNKPFFHFSFLSHLEKTNKKTLSTTENQVHRNV